MSLDPREATYYRDPETGFLMMPGTKRPDGTWRKPRRIKEGYVPQDEVPLYESKGKQFAKSAGSTSGLSAGILNMKIDTFDSKTLIPVHIPGLGPVQNATNSASAATKENKNAKKKKKSSSNTNSNGNNTSSNNSGSNVKTAVAESAVATDPARKLRNLKKKLRDIEALQLKLSKGLIENPEPEQLEKVTRKNQVEKEIAELEKALRI